MTKPAFRITPDLRVERNWEDDSMVWENRDSSVFLELQNTYSTLSLKDAHSLVNALNAVIENIKSLKPKSLSERLAAMGHGATIRDRSGEVFVKTGPYWYDKHNQCAWYLTTSSLPPDEGEYEILSEGYGT